MKLVIGVTTALVVSTTSGAAPGQSLSSRPEASAPEAEAKPAFLVEPIAEKTVETLPGEPLYWRVERFPSLAEAQRAAGPLSLAADAWGRSWLFTLAPPGGSSAAGRKLAEIGPVPIPKASRYLLRINRAGGPPGVSTPVHTHPGSEAFYVLSGVLTQKTGHGDVRVEAGRAMNGHEPGMTMQLFSTGHADLQQLVMFVVDAEQAFSTPARFD